MSRNPGLLTGGGPKTVRGGPRSGVQPRAVGLLCPAGLVRGGLVGTSPAAFWAFRAHPVWVNGEGQWVRIQSQISHEATLNT